MSGTLFAAAALALHGVTGGATLSKEMTIRYASAYLGKVVTVRTDSGITRTFAGKMVFQNETTSWCSVCANIHRHISEGSTAQWRLHSTKEVGGNIRRAGNIVARYFNEAKSAEQCAGLQLAVWEALEDGGDTPDFLNGHFAASADAMTMAFAAKYYEAVNTAAEAVFFEPAHEPIQAQLSTRF